MPRIASMSQKTFSASKAGKVPSYLLDAVSSVQEGEVLTITLNTLRIPNGNEIPYTITGITSAEIAGAPLTGVFEIQGNSGQAVFTIIADEVAEGTQYLTLTLDRTGDSITIDLIDTTVVPDPPSYNSLQFYGYTNNVINFAAGPITSINEGETFGVVLNTTNLNANTTVNYTIGNVQAGDLSSGIGTKTSDTLATTANVNNLLATITATADSLTEGSQAADFTIAAFDSQGVATGSLAKTITINDTSLDPTYSLNASSPTVNEGGTISITLTTTDVPDFTDVPYTITGGTGFNFADDISSGAETGNFNIVSNTDTITFTFTEDFSYLEGDELFTLSLDNGADDVTVTVVDTSIDTTPRYNTITPNVTSLNEDGNVTFTLSTEYVPDGTSVSFTLVSVTGTVAATDFDNPVLSFTINSNTATRTLTLSEDSITEGTESFRIRLAATDSNGASTGSLQSSNAVSIADTSVFQAVGQVEFVSAGTTTNWTVPADTFSISVVSVGGGGGGAGGSNIGRTGGGGGGGALAYKNNISVTPGDIIAVTVGAGGAGGTTGNDGSAGTDSYIENITAGGQHAIAPGGGAGGQWTGSSSPGGTGGDAVQPENDGGGNGGNGGFGGFSYGGGGGGAGGYSGAGGTGGNYQSARGGDGTGGAAGAGGASGGDTNLAGGGGVGIDGQGTSGTGGVSTYQKGTGGSGGTDADGAAPGIYGGGAGGSQNSGSRTGGTGAGGAVRIIYPGSARQFPNTRVTDEAPSVPGTYDTLVASTTSFEERETTNYNQFVTFTVSTTDVPAGTTVGYSIVGVSGTVTENDFYNADTEFTIDENGEGTVTMYASADFLTETGGEVFKIRLSDTDSLGNDTENLESPNVTIVDIFPATVYNSISLDKATYNEGDTVNITVDYTGNEDKVMLLSYTVSTNDASGGYYDFEDYRTSGTLRLLDGNTTQSSAVGTSDPIVITEDLLTEGAETLTVTLGNLSNLGETVPQLSATATINDTSLTPRQPGSSLVKKVERPSNAAGHAGLYILPKAMTDDYVLCSNPNNSNQAVTGAASTSEGVCWILDIAAANTPSQWIARIDMPQTVNTGAELILGGNKFGEAASFSPDETEVAILCPAHESINSGTLYRGKVFIYDISDPTSPVLDRTCEQPNSYLQNGYTNFGRVGQIQWHGNFIIVSGHTGGVCWVFNATTGALITEYTAIDDGWTAWGADIWGDGSTPLAVMGNPFHTGQGSARQGLLAVHNANNGQLQSSYTREGYRISGGSQGGTQSFNFYLGSAVCVGNDRFVFASIGDDYNGFTDAGRIRFTTWSGSIRAVLNHPNVVSTSTDELNYEVLAQSIKRNKTGDKFMILWGDTYDQSNAIARVYNNNGAQQGTDIAIDTSVDPARRINDRDGCISDQYLALAFEEDIGSTVTWIYIY